MRCFKLIEQIAQLQKKIADLELSLNSQRSINSRLITENNRLIQEIASIGNPIHLSVSTFEADHPEPYSNVIRANCDDTWKDIEMSVKGDTAEMLVQFYNRDMEKLYNNYRKLEELDAGIFAELKVSVPSLKESLKTRLQGLKHIYWDLLFQRYDKVTSRLTSKGRKKVINRLNDNTAIDFTLENIFQLTLWIIKHSNTLFDEQITEYFYSLCNTENIHRYKSNKRWNDDDWRYLKENLTEHGHIKQDKVRQLKNIVLDYRIIVTSWQNFDTSWCCRLSESCFDFLSDTIIIGKNLGFDIDFELPTVNTEISISDWNNFNICTKDGKVFANVKLYKNGNRHVKFCKEFMQKLNVEMARINGWVQDKSEAIKEMDIPADVINSVWKTNLQIGIESGKKLLGLPEA